MSTTALTALCFNMSDIQQAEGGVWLPLVPKGIFTGIDGRTWNNSQPDLVVARFTKKRPFDVEHSTHIKAPKGEPAPAYGWILKLENRDGEVWGYTEWNKNGQEMIDGKKYAFYSPAFGYLEDGTVTAVASSGLTNDPNLDVPALNHKEEKNMKLPKLILDALSLSEDATEQDALTAINSMQSKLDVALNRASSPDLNHFVPKATYETALNRATQAEEQLAKISELEIESLVQGAVDDGKVAPADKEMYIGLCSTEKGRDQFVKFVEGAPKIATNSKVKTPTDETKPTLADHEIALCRKMNVTHDEFLAAKQSMKGAQ